MMLLAKCWSGNICGHDGQTVDKWQYLYFQPRHVHRIESASVRQFDASGLVLDPSLSIVNCSSKSVLCIARLKIIAVA